MIERPLQKASDKYIWWCRQCKSSKSVRDGSFFQKSLQKWLLLLNLWARDYPVTDAAEEAEISRSTAIDVFQWLREVCTTKLLQSPIQLGGPGCIVQIDESLFRHKPKVCLYSSQKNDYDYVNHFLELVICRGK